MVDSSIAKAVLAALVEGWPTRVDLDAVAISEPDVRRLIVTISTTVPRGVLEFEGLTWTELRARLRRAVPHKAIELVVRGADAEVPDLIGMTVEEAATVAHEEGFHLTTGDPDGLPINYYVAHGRGVIVGQRPAARVLVERGATVVVDILDGGGGGESGDREPRTPRPPGGLAYLERSVIEEMYER